MVAVAAPPVDLCRRRRRRRSSPPTPPWRLQKTVTSSGRGTVVALCSPSALTFCARLLRSPSALRPSHHRDSPHRGVDSRRRVGEPRSHSPRRGSLTSSRMLRLKTRLGRLGTRLGRFPKGDWDSHTSDSDHRGRLAEPTGRQGRQLARATGTPGRRLASPTRPLPFGEATSPVATRPRDLRPPGPTRPRATTACAATSSAVPS